MPMMTKATAESRFKVVAITTFKAWIQDPPYHKGRGVGVPKYIYLVVKRENGTRN